MQQFWRRAQALLDVTLIDSAGMVLTVGQILLAALALVGGLLTARLVERLVAGRLDRSHVGPDMLQLVRRLLFYSLVAVVVLAVLAILGIPLTAFAFVSGAIGFGFGFGFGAQNHQQLHQRLDPDGRAAHPHRRQRPDLRSLFLAAHYLRTRPAPRPQRHPLRHRRDVRGAGHRHRVPAARYP